MDRRSGLSEPDLTARMPASNSGEPESAGGAPDLSSGGGSGRRVPIEFLGSGLEYFRIWIVNMQLAFLTLGIYSAWSKVRNRRYFYSNLRVDGHAFEYLADPITILKSRIVAFAALFIYVLAENLFPLAGVFLLACLLIILPWLLCRSLSFNHRMTSYRNVQFRFHGRYREAFMISYVWPLLAIVTLGAMAPYSLRQTSRFVVNNSAYGTERLQFGASYRDYAPAFFVPYGIFVVAALFLLAPLGGGLLLRLAAFMGLLFFASAVFNALTTNVYYNAIGLRNHQFHAHLKVGGLALVYFTNYLLIILTLGLYSAAAKVRLTRYIAGHIDLMADGEMDDFTAAKREDVSALGDEMGQAFDFDIGAV